MCLPRVKITFTEQIICTHAVNLSGYAGETVIIDGTGINTAGFTGGINITGTSGTHLSGVHISNLTVQNWRKDGTHEYDCIHLRYVDDCEVDHCTTSNCSNSGILAWNCNTGSIHDNTVIDAGHSDNAGDLWEEAISVTGEDVNIYNNLIKNVTYLGNLGCIGICAKEKSKRIRIYNNHIKDLTRSGVIYVDAWNAPITDQMECVWIYNNFGEHCLSGIGVSAESGGYIRNVWVYNNIVYHHYTTGFTLYGNVFNGHKSYIYFYNNLAMLSLDNGGAGFSMESDNISGDIVFKNNISYNLGTNGEFRCLDSVVGSVTYANNVAWGANSFNPDMGGSPKSEVMGGATWADPLFIDPTGASTFHVYHESPAWGNGVDLSAIFTADKDGVARTAPWDIGPYMEAAAPNSPVPNVIFHAGIDTNLSEFTTTVGTGLSSDAAAGMRSTAKGLKVVISDTTARYCDKSGLNSTTGVLGAYIWIDPNTLTMNNGNNFGFWSAKRTDTNTVFFLLLVKSGSIYQCEIGYYDNAGSAHYMTNATLNDAPNYIEIQCVRSGSGLSNGTMAFKVNGVLWAGVTGIANDTRWTQIDLVRLGAGTVIAIPATTTGTIYLDEEIIYDNNVAWEGA